MTSSGRTTDERSQSRRVKTLSFIEKGAADGANYCS
jgi:hypothetical protein